jgi:acetylcholinesterase
MNALLISHIANTDEGAALVRRPDLNTTAELRDYLLTAANFHFRAETIDRLLDFYPDNPAVGSPYGTSNISSFPGTGHQYKRLGAIYGDYILIGPDRYNAETSVAQGRDTWKYRFDIAPAGTPLKYGVYHGIEIPLVFSIPTPTLTASQNGTGRFMTRSFISFVHDLDPNYSTDNLSWPRYNDEKVNLVFGDVPHIENDTFRHDAIKFINQHPLEWYH